MKKLNEYFHECIAKHERQEVKRLFLKHKRYILKMNSPAVIYKALLDLELYDLGFSIAKNYKRYKRSLSAKDLQLLEESKIWCYCVLDCNAKALHYVNEYINKSNEAQKKRWYRYQAIIYISLGRYTEAIQALLSSLPNPSIVEGNFSFLSDLAFSYLYAGDVEKANIILTKQTSPENLDPRNYRRYLHLKAAILCEDPNGNKLDAINTALKGISLCDDEEANRVLYYTLGEIYKKTGKNEEAIQYFRRSLIQEYNHPKTTNIYTFEELVNLKDPSLTPEEILAAHCHPLKIKKTTTLKFFVLKNRTLTEHQDSKDIYLEDNYIDLHTGKISLNKKSHILSELQNRLCHLVISSGAVGIHISQLEWELFETIFPNYEVGLKRIENLLINLKKLGIKFNRNEQILSHAIDPDIIYVIPHKTNVSGLLSLLPFEDEFKRTDVEKALEIKTTMASLYLKKWLSENKIEKIKRKKNIFYKIRAEEFTPNENTTY